MANVLLKFSKNPKDGKSISFFRKKVCFVLSGVENTPKPGETWECFLWADRGKFYLVKPFKKIDKDELKEAEDRVNEFNKELFLMERQKNADFDKVVFDKHNKPYLRSTKPLSDLKKKYVDYVLKEVENNGKKEVWARLQLTDEDRREWQKQQK